LWLSIFYIFSSGHPEFREDLIHLKVKFFAGVKIYSHAGAAIARSILRSFTHQLLGARIRQQLLETGMV
jgi:hypothetical protein